MPDPTITCNFNNPTLCAELQATLVNSGDQAISSISTDDIDNFFIHADGTSLEGEFYTTYTNVDGEIRPTAFKWPDFGDYVVEIEYDEDGTATRCKIESSLEDGRFLHDAGFHHDYFDFNNPMANPEGIPTELYEICPVDAINRGTFDGLPY